MTDSNNNESSNDFGNEESGTDSAKQLDGKSVKGGVAKISIILDRGPLSEDEIKEFFRGLARELGVSEDEFKFVGQQELPKQSDPSDAPAGSSPAGGKGPTPSL